MKRFVLAMLFCACAGACSTVPFREAETVSMEGTDPAVLLSRFRDAQPERFRILSSVVFDFGGREFASLGVTAVDRVAGTFTAVALNPMGMKLFELSGTPDGATSGFLIEAIAQGRKGATEAIGEDIRRIYFGLVPSSTARSECLRDRIVYRERSGEGMLEFVFAGAEGFLVRKEFTEDGETVWKVRYYEYQRIGEKVYPRGIVLDNLRYGYRLIIRVKEIAS